MTSDRNPLGGFEDKLLRELKSVVAQRKAERPARTPLWRRPRVISVASAGALAIGAAIGLPLVGGESTAPPASAAFDLTTNDDGTITVTIYEFSDADGLEAQLEEHGVAADVAYTPTGKRCQPNRYQPAPKDRAVRVDWRTKHISFTLRPDAFADDETLVITTGSVGLRQPDVGLESTAAMIVSDTAVGTVEECVPEDDPNDPIHPRWMDGHLTYQYPATR